MVGEQNDVLYLTNMLNDNYNNIYSFNKTIPYIVI